MQNKTVTKKDGDNLNIMIGVAVLLLVIVIVLLLVILNVRGSRVKTDNVAQTSSSSQSSAITQSDPYLADLDANVRVGNGLELVSNTQTLSVGENVIIEVTTSMLNSNKGDNVASIVVDFDPETFNAEDIVAGPSILINVGKEIDNAAGIVKLDVANNEPFADNSVLATLTLKVKSVTTGTEVSLSANTQLGVPNSLESNGYGKISF